MTVFLPTEASQYRFVLAIDGMGSAVARPGGPGSSMSGGALLRALTWRFCLDPCRVHSAELSNSLKVSERRRNRPESVENRSESLCAGLWVPCRIFWLWFGPILGPNPVRNRRFPAVRVFPSLSRHADAGRLVMRRPQNKKQEKQRRRNPGGHQNL